MKKIFLLSIILFSSSIFAATSEINSDSTPGSTNSNQPKLIMVKPSNGAVNNKSSNSYKSNSKQKISSTKTNKHSKSTNKRKAGKSHSVTKKTQINNKKHKTGSQ